MVVDAGQWLIFTQCLEITQAKPLLSLSKTLRNIRQRELLGNGKILTLRDSTSSSMEPLLKNILNLVTVARVWSNQNQRDQRSLKESVQYFKSRSANITHYFKATDCMFAVQIKVYVWLDLRSKFDETFSWSHYR